MTGSKAPKLVRMTGANAPKLVRITGLKAPKLVRITGMTAPKLVRITGSKAPKLICITGTKATKLVRITGTTGPKIICITGIACLFLVQLTKDKHMHRNALQHLAAWKNDPQRKPLLVFGARQVGKTWLMKEFGATHYAKVAYISLDNNDRMKNVFQGDYDVKRLLTALQIEANLAITPQDTLIILDEIQEIPRALTALKYFCEEAREYSIVAAGSLLGITAKKDTGYPVGKVDTLNLFPMSFTEFLAATSNARFGDLLATRDWPMITTFNSNFAELLRHYYYVGGMPEVVATFVEYNDFKRVRRIQNRLLDDYRRDFSKHAPADIIPRLEMVWDSIPTQLARENKRFLYSSVRESGRAREFELALRWLMDAGLIYQTARITKPAIPLNAYRDTAFKVFFLDVGLLAAKAKLDSRTLLEGNQIFQEFKGALAEQYVQQQLRSELDIDPYYWTAERGEAEVDFLFQHGMNIVPLEVKAEVNLHAKSLKSYCQKYAPRIGARTSMSDYFRQDIVFANDAGKNHTYTLLDLPLYAMSQLLAECE